MNNSRLSHRFLSEIVCLFPPDIVIYSFYLAFLDCNFFYFKTSKARGCSLKGSFILSLTAGKELGCVSSL